MHGSKLIKHVVEGEAVPEYTDSQARKLLQRGQKLLHSGTISLQSESHPVEFRKIELRKPEDLAGTPSACEASEAKRQPPARDDTVR